MKIILATKNQGKLKEFQQLSKGMGYEFIAIPEELQEKWGYPPLPKDLKKNFLGGTLAKLAGINASRNKLNFPGENKSPKGKTSEGDKSRKIMKNQKKKK